MQNYATLMNTYIHTYIHIHAYMHTNYLNIYYIYLGQGVLIGKLFLEPQVAHAVSGDFYKARAKVYF